MRNVEQFTGAKINSVNKKREPDIKDIEQQYSKIMAGFSDKNRLRRESKINEAFDAVKKRLSVHEGYIFGERQQLILKLKLARHLLKIPKEAIDHNTLSDAIIESPRFLETDKGSLHHLLEVHEQKTIEKIARIDVGTETNHQEVREKINPYEAMFTTISGKYYLARLTKKQHLNEESLYMKNCVGTSDSYLKRIKNGETEIFSLRKVEGDKPVITIEYNLKTGTIEQIKKKRDEYLSPYDPLLKDVIDGLSRLRGTKNDLGKFRELNKINPNELKNIIVQPYHLLTDQGEVHFRDLKLDKNPFIFSIGEIKLTPDISLEDATKLISIFDHAEFNPEQIAREPNKINENTKAYVGKLELGIFDKISQYNVEHIYTSFPEGRVKIEKDLKVGPITFKEFERKIAQYNQSVTDIARKIEISRHAEYMMRSKDFTTLKDAKHMSFVRLKVSDLGIDDYIARYEKIVKAAEELGLILCPPETAAHIRFHYINQPLNEWIRIGMKTIADDNGDQRIFDMGRNEVNMWIGGASAQADVWPHNAEFIFRILS